MPFRQLAVIAPKTKSAHYRVGEETKERVLAVYEGRTTKEIAAICGISRRHAYAAIKVLGLPVPTEEKQPFDYDGLYQHILSGGTNSSYAKLKGLTKNMVDHAVRKKYGTAKASFFLKRYRDEAK